MQPIKLYFLLLYLLFANLSYAQTNLLDNIVGELKNKKLYTQLDCLLNIKETQWFLPSSFHPSPVNEFNVITHLKYFTDFSKQGFADSVAYGIRPIYVVAVISRNDSILFANVERRVLSYKMRNSQKIFLRVDTIEVNKYLSRHNQKYTSTWEIGDFTNYENLLPRVEFENCGCFGFHIEDDAKKLDSLVESNNQNKLIKLASSIRPNERAVGSLGLYFLGIRGQKLSNYAANLLEINQHSKDIIYYCPYDYSGQTLCDFLKPAALVIWYKTFKERFGLL